MVGHGPTVRATAVDRLGLDPVAPGDEGVAELVGEDREEEGDDRDATGDHPEQGGEVGAEQGRDEEDRPVGTHRDAGDAPDLQRTGQHGSYSLTRDAIHTSGKWKLLEGPN